MNLNKWKTKKQAFGLSKDVTVHHGEKSKRVTAQHRTDCKGWRSELGEELQAATVNPLEKFGSGLFLGYCK